MNAINPLLSASLRITDQNDTVLFSARYPALHSALSSCAHLDSHILSRAQRIDISNGASGPAFSNGASGPATVTFAHEAKLTPGNAPSAEKPYSDIVERLRHATGPSRALDAEISRRFAQSDGDVQRAIEAGQTDFTSSVDHAATLVPDGYHWVVRGDGRAGCASPGGRYEVLPDAVCEGATPAIALCIAALEARTAQNNHSIALAREIALSIAAQKARAEQE